MPIKRGSNEALKLTETFHGAVSGQATCTIINNLSEAALSFYPSLVVMGMPVLSPYFMVFFCLM